MMIADIYIEGRLEDKTVEELDRIAASLLDDREQADKAEDFDWYFQCVDALDVVLDERIKAMSDPSPHLTL